MRTEPEIFDLSLRYKALFALFISFLIIAFVTTSCHGRKTTEAPTELTISFIPDEDLAAKVNRLQPIAEYLKSKLKLKKVNFIKCSSYAAVIEAMKAKKVDIAYYGQFSYLLAHDNAGAEALVMTGSTAGPRIEHCAIAVNSQLPVYNTDDLKKQASGLTLGFSDPASTSGHIIPRGYLVSIGLDPQKCFKNMYFSSSQAASLFMVKAGELNVVCVSNSSITKMIVQGKMEEKDIRIIWTSPGLMPSPVAIRSDFPTEFKEKIRQAYINLPIEAPSAWHNFVEKEYLYYDENTRKNLIYLPSYDSLYNNVRKLVNNLDMKVILK